MSQVVLERQPPERRRCERWAGMVRHLDNFLVNGVVLRISGSLLTESPNQECRDNHTNRRHYCNGSIPWREGRREGRRRRAEADASRHPILEDKSSRTGTMRMQNLVENIRRQPTPVESRRSSRAARSAANSVKPNRVWDRSLMGLRSDRARAHPTPSPPS